MKSPLIRQKLFPLIAPRRLLLSPPRYIVNGTFAVDLAGWTFLAPRRDYSAVLIDPTLGTRTAAGRLRVSAAADAIYPVAQVTLQNLVPGRAYRVSVDKSGSANTYRTTIYDTGGISPAGVVVRRENIWQSGVQFVNFTANRPNHVLELLSNVAIAGQFIDYDNIIITQR